MHFVALQTQCPEAMVSPLFEGIRDEVESRKQMLQSTFCTQQVPQPLCLWGDVRANYTSATISIGTVFPVATISHHALC